MGNGVIQRSAMEEKSGDADEKVNGDQGKARGPDQSDTTSQPHSDSTGSIPSNLERSSPTSKESSGQGLRSRRGGRRILIVDDEANIADTLQLIFKMKRYDARVAYSAEGAIELIAEWRPDLAVLDVILPEMNGIDLAIVIKANHPACHVLLFSGHANTAMLLEEAGKKGYQFEVLAKPVYPDVMLERAAELLMPPDEPAYN
jgi:CheY-like chemotaxis protein